MRLLSTTAFVFAMAAASAALAEPPSPSKPAPGNPAGMRAGTREKAPGIPAAHEANNADRLFVRALAAGGMAEIELGKLAERKAGNDTAADFGKRMIQDHARVGDRLSELAKTDNIPLPDSIDQDHQSLRAQLEKLSGVQFDRLYIDGQIADHQEAAQLLEYEIGSGQDARLKAFASDVLPTVLQHLRLAQSVKAEISGQVRAEPTTRSPGR